RLNTFRGGEDCPCGWRKADLECDRHPDNRDRLGRALRRTNSGHARPDWIVPMVHPEICVARSARGGGNTPRRACIYRADTWNCGMNQSCLDLARYDKRMTK